MADDEQFSLCWNNFNSNLSAGFHESLCRGDLVDVTLAAEGQFVKAHRLVLSVCSPYFRRMFTQMPANQHAFVFLKDVSHSALKDLIQFMYCGEVNVKQDALPAFISTAEALQIKGLTDSEPAPSQSPAKPSTPAPQPQPQTITASALTTATTTTSPRTRTLNQRSRYKLESEDSGDESKPTNQLVLQTQTQQHQQPTLVQQTQKRPAQRSITPHTAPTVKRIKNNDPLEGTDATTTTQITVQAVTDSKSATGEPEYIDLPIDLPTKSEPDYAEEAADVEGAEQEATYVEDDSYGDMKYDESYFTENDDAGGAGGGATTSSVAVKQSASFSDSYVSDTGEPQQQTSEAQVVVAKRGRGRPPKQNVEKETKIQEIIDMALREKGEQVSYVSVLKGGMAVLYNGHHFKPTFKRGGCMFYRCIRYDTKKCPARIFVHKSLTYSVDLAHNHEEYALLEQHGSIIPSVKVPQHSPGEMRTLNSNMKLNKESLIFEIVTVPRVINSADGAKPKIKDIITLPPAPLPSTLITPTTSELMLPPGADVTIKKVSPGPANRTLKLHEPSTISVIPNQSIHARRSPNVVDNTASLPPFSEIHSVTIQEKKDAKMKLGTLTSKDLKEQMKNRLKMALMNARK